MTVSFSIFEFENSNPYDFIAFPSRSLQSLNIMYISVSMYVGGSVNLHLSWNYIGHLQTRLRMRILLSLDCYFVALSVRVLL